MRTGAFDKTRYSAAVNAESATPSGESDDSRHAPLGEFASWPKLESCPECDYNLTGLPPGRACPECGWGEGHLGIMLPAWSSRHAVDRGWRNVAAVALAMFGLTFTCCVAGSWWMALALLALAIVLPVPLARLLIPRSREYDTQVIPFIDGVLICRHRDKPVYKRWRDLASVTLHSTHRVFHDVFLRPRRDLPQPRLAERIVLEGSIEAAKIVTKALHDRIRRAATDGGLVTTDEHK